MEAREIEAPNHPMSRTGGSAGVSRVQAGVIGSLPPAGDLERCSHGSTFESLSHFAAPKRLSPRRSLSPRWRSVAAGRRSLGRPRRRALVCLELFAAVHGPLPLSGTGKA